MDHLPIALTFDAFTDIEFWTGVGILAGIYTIFSLGLQLNVGYTGIQNFGQAGFAAVGAYAMAIFVTDTGINFWISIPLAMLVAVIFALIIGLPSLRLRADYFAIATIAASEAIRIYAANASITKGTDGIFGFSDSWDSVSESIEDFFANTIGWTDVPNIFPLFIVVWAVAILLTFGLSRIQKTPWGRVLRAVREDEDAARALGKNVFAYKLQSLAISAAVAAIAGVFLALNLKFVIPDEFVPLITFIGYAVLVLGGLASYWGVAVGSIVLWTVLEGLRFLELP
jgi:branched-chain amino acid transport system permease protein